MPLAVINTQDFVPQEAIALLEENGCAVHNRSLIDLTEEEVCREIRGIDAVIAGGEQYTEAIFHAADRLRIVARTGAGYDKVDIEAATRHGVWVTTTPGVNRHTVADFTICLILSLLRNIPAMAADMKAGRWHQVEGRELASLTVGVVGAGAIGKEVIRRAKAFDATVLAYDVQPNRAFAEELEVPYVSLDELFHRSNIVSLHVPLNEDTVALMDRRRLNQMRRDAYLINTSRPGVVDKEALIDALKKNEIAGAAIDVHDPAPCSPDDPLVQLDNVIATPWAAGRTEESTMNMSMGAATDVINVLQGRRPTSPVNRLQEMT